MLAFRKCLFAGLLAVLLAAPARAQFGGMVSPRVGFGFPANPALVQQALYNQALYNQALYNQALYNQALYGGGYNQGLLPGRPAYLAAGRISSTGALGVVPYAPPTWSDPYTYGSAPYSYFQYSTPATPSYLYPAPYDTTGDTLRALGDYTLALGRYAQDLQRARLLNQEVERAKIETRRRLYEEWLYQQSLIPTGEDRRRAQLALDYARARKQAPVTEVLSGTSLNVLLAHLRNLHARGQRGPALPLDEELTKHLNVTTDFGGNIGLIKTGKVNWPLSLRIDAFTRQREKLDEAIESAFFQARTNGKVEPALIKDLEKGRKAMEDILDKLDVDQLTMTQFMEARRYLNYLGDVVRALQDPNVANYFNRKYEARGKTVGDLIDYMSREGLKFTGSMAGDEGAYRSLYTILAAYDEAVSALVSR